MWENICFIYLFAFLGRTVLKKLVSSLWTQHTELTEYCIKSTVNAFSTSTGTQVQIKDKGKKNNWRDIYVFR